jgi:lipoyl(octanoyl) transferase
MPIIAVHRLGLMPYADVWKFQEELFNEIIQQKLKSGAYLGHHHLIFTEHYPVYTLGKSGQPEHLIHPLPNVEMLRINRGGDITFHGPGQLVVYPILDLEHFFTDIKKYMRFLEEVVMVVLAQYGIEGQRLQGATGVWLEANDPLKARKICAMGVRSSRWVTMHGLALNVNTDLSYFSQIIPCGIADKGVSSMQAELGHPVDLMKVQDQFIRSFADIFSAELIEE